MIIFVVVLYGIDVDRSSTIASLLASLGNFSQAEYLVVVLDNSPDRVPQEIVLESRVHYIIFGKNYGLARAYNIALDRARDLNAVALVTLDQDSIITIDYLSQVFLSVSSLSGDRVALCPSIRSAGRIISPFGFTVLGFPWYGFGLGSLYAINSFSVYSVKYLNSVGGFDEYYWLDALDFSTYAQIARQGYKVKILDVIVDHDLSLLSGNVNAWRMSNIAHYEASFLMEYASIVHIFTGCFRLIGRTIRVRRYGLDASAAVPIFLAIIRGARIGWRRRMRRWI